ncbi:RNI-like superfamily protein [Melia azedarach]|uniref:RNI-like superfamily protein n=1 Tax=Melia azedarach TaxID=155640 RepID=A0ACC1YR67_MELAZ|nr:RNI-like superfamily protein [Melia azedarach]
MERDEAAKKIADSLKKLDLNPIVNLTERNVPTKNITASFKQLDLNPRLTRGKAKTPSLVSLCLGVVGKHLEDIIEDLGEIAINFPADIKIAVTAIARRRKLLSDEVITSLAESSWEILDISGSDVSDSGLVKVAEVCKSLRAVDISRCDRITAAGVSELLQHCNSLETLRCGGSPRSDHTARRCLGILKPKLNDVEGDSWEELVNMEIGQGAQSLRWFVWPKIDKDSLEMLSTECPRIVVNPKPSPFRFRGFEVPQEAFPDTTLDDLFVKDIDPTTWAVSQFTPRVIPSSLLSPNELSMAEKFRLAFVERDTRLAPKRAKNARQHQRRAERDWMMTNSSAKAIVLASKASKSLSSRK